MTGEDGAATVWVLVLTVVVGAACAFVVLLTSAVALRHRAAAVADVAALTAATHWAEPDDVACASARTATIAVGAELRACTVEGGSVVVEIAISTPRWRGGPVTARARAGPVDNTDEVLDHHHAP